MAANYNSFSPMPYSQRSSSFDEQKWLSLVRSTLEKPSKEDEGRDEVKTKVCVFFVPKNLFFLKPEAFMPQLFAVGPYHHWVPHLYDMERYKLAAAQKIQAELNGLSLHELVTCIVKHEQRIRSHYHKHLDFTGETLAWMLVIDASFFLDFLRNFTAEAEVGEDHGKSSKHIWDSSRIRMAYNTVSRDLVMLENQMPFFLQTKILRRCRRSSSSKKAACEELSKMLIAFVKQVSPFKFTSNITFLDVRQHHHLLELLYSVIVPKVDEGGVDPPDLICLEIDAPNCEEEEAASDRGVMRRAFDSVYNYASEVNGGATIQMIKKYIIIGPIKLLTQVPWRILSNFPGISAFKQVIEPFIFHGQEKAKKDDVSDGSSSVSRPPLFEEITIPSVTELTSAGISFMPSNGDLTTIRFERKQKSAAIYLPTVILDANTEVLLRNLVAYESAAEPGPMVLTRYTELMNGIIDTEEDVKLLRKAGIIQHRMKSDGEVADLWNGMSRSVKLSKVDFLDKVLEDVNGYYNSRWKVRSTRFVEKYVFGSWQILTLLAAILLLLLTCFQAFCNVYSCGDRWFNVTEKS